MKDKIFFIPITSQGVEKESSSYILYSPFVHGCCLISSTEAHDIQKALNEEPSTVVANRFPMYASLLNFDKGLAEKAVIRSPHNYTKLSILPTLNCNFKCSYCYSAGGRDKTIIDFHTLDIALSDFFKNADNKSARTIFFSGGGEPLTAWAQIEYAVLKAETLAKNNKIKLKIIIITNGYLLNENIIHFCKEHNLSVCVSFEITEYAQNLSRGHWKRVSNNIRKCISAQLLPSLNATITPHNVHCMDDMLEHLLQNFPEIKHVTMEPVTPNGGFASVEEMHMFYDMYMDSFSSVRRRASALGVNIGSTILDNLKRVAVRHCQGKLCLTPSASYTICHCASSPKENRYKKCCYGEIMGNESIFDYDRFAELQNINMLHRKKCCNCYAKWNCAGGCMSKFDVFPQEQQDEYCRYYREHLKRLLLEEIARLYEQQYGKKIDEILSHSV